jgi:LuxR family maltose regulon positive regulatory protein
MELLTEYWRKRDYESILSMRLTNMALARVDGILFTDVAKKLLDECPEEIKKRHPMSVMRIAYAFISGGQDDEYRKALAEAKRIIESSGLPDEKYRRLLGEWKFASMLAPYPDFRGMLELLEEAWSLTGGRVELIDSSQPFLFGCSGVLYTFHTKPGMLRAEMEMMSRCVALYSSMTGGGGMGADILFEAEARYFQGDVVGSKELCRKAYGTGLAHEQDLICIGSAYLLAEIAILQTDADMFGKACESMCVAASMHQENAPLCEKVLELCRTGLNLSIGSNSTTPEWILIDGERMGPSNYRNWVSFLRVFHHSLNPDLNYAIDLASKSLEEIEEHYIFFRLTTMLFESALLYGAGRRSEACDMLSAAGEMLNPDGFYQPYGLMYNALPPFIDEYLAKLPKNASMVVHKARRQYTKGRSMIHKAVFQKDAASNLTRRELEVAGFAAKGMRNKEIAAALGISAETVRTHLAKVHQKLLIDRRALIAEKLRMMQI